MNKRRFHRELLKQQLFSYDWSNTPINKMILVELDYKQITCQTEGPDGFTHWKSSLSCIENLIERMNYEVKSHPNYDLIIVDKSEKLY